MIINTITGGGGGAGLLVTISDNNDGHFIADKTAREIKTALDSGINPSFVVSGTTENTYISLAYFQIKANGRSIIYFTSLFKDASALTAGSLDDYPEHYSDN